MFVIVSDDIFGTGPEVRTIFNELSHVVNVFSSDSLRHCQVHCNQLRHSQLVELQVWVWSDDSSCGEINSLAHEIPSETTLLASKTSSDGLQRFS